MASPIDISRIDVPARIRPVNEAWAAEVAESMKAVGQMQPIVVRPTDTGERYLLVIGAHRLAAAKRLAWTEILAEIRTYDGLRARLAEIDENLIRHELTALDRAIFLAERKEVWEELYPQTKHGGNRKSLTKQAKNQVANDCHLIPRFTAEAAERTGLSERTIRSAVALAKALSPEVLQLVRSTYLADHAADLTLLTKLRPEEQIKALRTIEAGHAPNLRKAIGVDAAGDDQERVFRTLTSAWARADARTRKRFLGRIGQG